MKKKTILFAAAALSIGACCSPAVEPAIPSDSRIEKNVEKILSGMTLEEKVGQMTQITATAIDRKSVV